MEELGKTILEFFSVIPTDVMIAIILNEVKLFFADRLWLVGVIGFIVYKTSWSWDDAFWVWLKNKIGLRDKNEGIKR